MGSFIRLLIYSFIYQYYNLIVTYIISLFIYVIRLIQVYKDDRAPVVVEIDDETDADMASVLYDWYKYKCIFISTHI
jgi:hypothetical protein